MGAPRGRLAVELCAFAVLAAFAAGHWAALLAEPPTARVFACVAIACATGLALAASASLRPAGLAQAARAAVALLGLAGGLLAMGLEARLLAPAAWEELGTRLGIGLQGSSQLDLPYAGDDEWTRLGLLLLIPAALALAAALAFWPARRRELCRGGALAVLVALYAFAATWEAPSRELWRGLALLLAIAAWIWLPRLGLRRALPGLAAVLASGLVALPLAARVEAAAPLVDYKSWSLFGPRRDVGFSWDHSYGPLDWPQRGTTVLQVRAQRPLYWRTTALDTFDGRAWTDSPSFVVDAETRPPPSRLTGAAPALVQRNSRWLEPVRVAVRGLSSELLVTAGTTYEVHGVELAAPTPSGTSLPTALPLRSGSIYSLLAYVPDPTESELRRADSGYPPGLERYTSFALPAGGPGAPEPVAVRVPLGDRSPAAVRRVHRQLEGSAYEQMHELAVSLVAGQATTYDAVAAIERHLKSAYEYSQTVSDHPDPLPAFLFEDRAGYCQQFSGAMALMLRMVGIPARVVAGFAPGVRGEEDQTVFTVRDLDAHSWVEVWFPGIGWVTFDPTPSASPAEAVETTVSTEAPVPVGGATEERPLSLAEAERRGALAAPQAAAGEGEGRSALPLVLLALGGGYGLLVWARRRRLAGPAGPEAQVRELERALERLGWAPAAGGTLLQIEQRLRERAGPAAARYAARLREHRYRAGQPRPPGPRERGSLRRALRRGGGPLRWWRVLRALPPGGPALRG